MPKIDRDEVPSGPVVRGFAGTGFRVGDTVYPDGLLLAPDWVRGWAAPALEALKLSDVEDLLGQQPPPEFLLLGSGSTMRRPSPVFIAAVEAGGVGVEVMDSRAAARAWGMLRSEGRWIVAALLPLGG